MLERRIGICAVIATLVKPLVKPLVKLMRRMDHEALCKRDLARHSASKSCW